MADVARVRFQILRLNVLCASYQSVALPVRGLRTCLSELLLTMLPACRGQERIGTGDPILYD